MLSPPGSVSAPSGKTALITGANAGIGKDLARQLALRPEFARICLACRNQDRATQAKAELEAVTGRSIFDIILMDIADLGSVRAGLAAIDGSIDALVMNAGVIGDKKLMNLTADGVTTLFATHVLGHAVLGEVAVFVGSEAARGIPKLRFKRPSFASTSTDQLATSSTAATSLTRNSTATWPSDRSSASGPCGWPPWRANTSTSD
jgi:NAD(P)-dependent dehydrogenase (short-subunit alcohol dehydrogenase family)